jgi:hypothetical protein
MQDILLLFKPVKAQSLIEETVLTFKSRGYLSNFSAKCQFAECQTKGKRLLFLRCQFMGLSAVIIDKSVIIQTTTLDEAFDVATQIVQLHKGVNFLEIK